MKKRIIGLICFGAATLSLASCDNQKSRYSDRLEEIGEKVELDDEYFETAKKVGEGFSLSEDLKYEMNIEGYVTVKKETERFTQSVTMEYDKDNKVLSYTQGLSIAGSNNRVTAYVQEEGKDGLVIYQSPYLFGTKMDIKSFDDFFDANMDEDMTDVEKYKNVEGVDVYLKDDVYTIKFNSKALLESDYDVNPGDLYDEFAGDFVIQIFEKDGALVFKGTLVGVMNSNGTDVDCDIYFSMIMENEEISIDRIEPKYKEQTNQSWY